LALFDLAALESASPRAGAIDIGVARLVRFPALSESIFLASIELKVQNLDMTNGP
jgi:hypothetical protein